MNSVFLGFLTLFLAQEAVGRDNLCARAVAVLFAGVIAYAFIHSLT